MTEPVYGTPVGLFIAAWDVTAADGSPVLAPDIDDPAETRWISSINDTADKVHSELVSYGFADDIIVVPAVDKTPLRHARILSKKEA